MFEVWSGNLSGSFTSTGQNVFLPFPTGVDFINVYNETNMYAEGTGAGVQFYWRAGMPVGQGVQWFKTNAGTTINVDEIAANEGFFFQDTSVTTALSQTALTGITANGGGYGSPQLLTANTNGLSTVAGDDVPAGIVRVYSTVGAQQLAGIDFSVANIVANTSMDLIFMPAIADADPGAGTYAVIPFNPYIYPNNRYITKVIVNPANSFQAIVTLSVVHTFQIGQKVRFIVPQVTNLAFGMTQLNGLAGTIVNVGAEDANDATNTITVDINVSSFGTWENPLTTAPGFSWAQVVPFGENTGAANLNPYGIGTVFPAPTSVQAPTPVYPYSDSVMNTAQKGLLLVAGANSPAGVNTDVISWVAGKSWNK